MAFSVKGRRVLLLAFFSTFAALAVSFSLYYLINYKRGRKKGGFIDVYKNRDGEKTPSSVTEDLELAEILKEHGHGEFTKGTMYKLLELLQKVEDCTLEKLLGALLNCSAFTTNQNAIRECGGLPQLVSLLVHPNKAINIRAAQVLSNLAMNETNQESLKGNICDVIKNIEYHDIVEDEEVILEHFRLLVNLSATNVAHDEIITGTQEYFRILTQAVSRQIQLAVLRLLVNLSCNPKNLGILLEFKPLLILQTFMLPDNPDDIILRAITISANLLSSLGNYSQLQQTVLAEHINVLYGELMGLLDHTNQDIQCQAKRALRSIFAFRIMYTK
ncbi:Armadillo repeat containing [Porites harrisoni]